MAEVGQPIVTTTSPGEPTETPATSITTVPGSVPSPHAQPAKVRSFL